MYIYIYIWLSRLYCLDSEPSFPNTRCMCVCVCDRVCLMYVCVCVCMCVGVCVCVCVSAKVASPTQLTWSPLPWYEWCVRCV